MSYFRRSLLVIFVLLFTFSCKKEDHPEQINQDGIIQKDFLSNVNPFIGTAPLTDIKKIGYTPPDGWRVWAGLTYPGSSLPNALVQLSPITEYGTGSGYQYEDKEILGFTHTNKGHWNLCNIPILPVSGNNKAPFKSSFSHQKEKASPGYYEVFLEDYRVNVRLSSSLRCGIHEYTFEDNIDRKVLLDLGKANNRISDWEISLIGDKEIQGFQKAGDEIINFSAKLSHPVEKLEKVKKGEQNGYALLHLKNGGEGPVLLKIGLSYVSIQNASENLEKEMGSLSFDKIHQRAKNTWNHLLSKIEVKGGTDKENELFYTSFYRSFLWPALRSDINGEFKDVNGDLRNEGFNYYTNPSFWDTYRNKLVLIGLISPKVTQDIIKSLLDEGGKTGFIPTFFHGDHAAPFITGSYLRGLYDFDVQKAYSLLLNNAYKEGGTRPYIKEYINNGFISDPYVAYPNVETKGKAGVSKTLEYAYDDYSLALLANELNDREHFQDLMNRSKNYRNVFDSTTNFMRGRLDNGDWITPFDPQYPYYEYMFREGNAWQLSFYVPHDMPGLVRLYGGKERFEEKLDSLFTLPWDANHIARNVSGFIGQYSQGNQPGHEIPFSYYFVDKPEKSQEIIDDILANFYGIGTSGLALSGMDDAGEMSSWYVFSAIGLYPLSPADDEYLVTVPIFDEVKWTTGHDKEVLIIKPEEGRKLKTIKINDQLEDGYFISHNLFKNGGKIEVLTE